MQTNVYRALLELLPQDPLLVGTVTAVNADATRTVQLPGGGFVRARGDAAVAATVFVRGGVIEGAAPALTAITIDV
jgi:hypothetical protein